MGLPSSRQAWRPVSTDEIAAAVQRLSIQKRIDSKQANPMPVLKALPYPGGRHPRIGFLDGSHSASTGNKFSVFLPWDLSQYVVVDLPEAIWVKRGKDRGFCIWHTDVPTMWTRQGISWSRSNGFAKMARFESSTLPNHVAFRRVVPTRDAIRMELHVTNRTDETLRGLVVQNCVMLKAHPSSIR